MMDVMWWLTRAVYVVSTAVSTLLTVSIPLPCQAHEKHTYPSMQWPYSVGPREEVDP